MSAPKKTKKPGRPRLPKGNAKAGYLRVRMTAAELRKIEAAARKNGQSVSEWVRSKLNATIQE